MTDSDSAHWTYKHPGAYRADPDSRAARIWPSGPIGEALWAITGRLNEIQRECARHGTSLLFEDPRDLAAVVEKLGKAGQLHGCAGTFENIGAYALAGWVASTRAEELRVDAGDAA